MFGVVMFVTELKEKTVHEHDKNLNEQAQLQLFQTPHAQNSPVPGGP